MSAIDEYLLTGSPEESNWRSVILFGRNAASYKFALAQALIDLAKQDRDSVTLDQLADSYTRHLCEHLAHSPKQSTSRSSKFIDACTGFNNGEGGKFARIPAPEYLLRLNRRNEYLIGSHHPLRETLIAQTGETPQLRWEYLKKVDRIATDLLPGERWKTEEREAPAF